jgi:hypothetical protein
MAGESEWEFANWEGNAKHLYCSIKPSISVSSCYQLGLLTSTACRRPKRAVGATDYRGESGKCLQVHVFCSELVVAYLDLREQP